MTDIRQLRYFVAVTEHGSVSAAATELHLSQSALSEALRKLELELGVELLARGSRGVSPTAAGEALLPAAQTAIVAFDAALDAARGQTGRLRVGFEAAGAGRLSTQSRARLIARFPHVRVEPRRYDWGGEVAALRDGECDVAFVWLPADLTGLKSEHVATEPRLVGLACEHRLAQRDAIGVDELNAEPIMWTRKAPRYWVDWWAGNPRPGGSDAPRALRTREARSVPVGPKAPGSLGPPGGREPRPGRPGTPAGAQRARTWSRASRGAPRAPRRGSSPPRCPSSTPAPIWPG